MTDLLSAAIFAVAAKVAAVLPEIIGEPLQGREIRRVKGQAPLPAGLDQMARDQSIEMVIEGGPGDLQLFLQIGCRDTLGAHPDDVAQNAKPRWVTEGSELGSVAFQGLHYIY